MLSNSFVSINSDLNQLFVKNICFDFVSINTNLLFAAKLFTSDVSTAEVTRSYQDCPFFQKRNLLYALIAAITALVVILSVVFGLKSSDVPARNTSDNITNSSSVALKGKHHIFEKNIWGGREVNKTALPMRHPATHVIISHTAGRTCDSFDKCSSTMQQIQSYQVSSGFSDIGYNFLIGSDGNIYVGRGWDVRNFHTDSSVAICFMGNYVFDELNPSMIEAAQELINYGIVLNNISPSYVLVAHNQTYATDSPGKNVYKEIKTWRNFDPKYIGT